MTGALRGVRRYAAAALMVAGAAAVLAVLAAGLPWLMWHVTGWPLPRQIPSLAALKAGLTTRESGQFILDVITCAGWACWAAIIAGVLREAAWQIRHLPELAHDRAGARHAGRLRERAAGLSPPRALAALLIGGVLLGVLAAVRGTSGALAGPAAPRVPVSLTAAGPAAGPPGPHGPAARRSRGGTLNQPAPPGEAPAGASPRVPGPGAPDSVRPVPPGIAPPAAMTLTASQQHAPADVSYTVREGDNLWDIAADHLGDGEKWHEIYALNQGRPQPGGQELTDPGLIYPGWVLLLPAHTASHSGPPAGTARPHGPTPAPAPATRPSPSSRLPVPAESPLRPGTAPAHPSPAHARPQPHERHHTAAVDLPSGALIGLSVATATGLAIVATRLHRRRWREPASVPGTAPTEPALGPALRRVRHAHLTSISQQAQNEDTGPADTEPAATGLPPAADGGIPPRREPSTETVNVATRNGQEIPLDFTSAPGIGFAGPGAAAAIRAIAVALLARRTRDQAEIILCGGEASRLMTPEAGDPGLAAVAGLTVIQRPDEALSRLESEIIHRRRLLDAADDDLAAYRAANPDEYLPTILVIALADGPRTGRLAAVLTLGQRLGIIGILPGPWPSGATCEIAATGHVTGVTADALSSLEGSRMFQLAPGEATEMLAALATANDSGRPPDATAGQPRPLPAPPASEPEPCARPVHLGILGPVQLHAGGELIARGLRRKATELLAYLAMHRGGATSEAILEALWPDTPVERAAPIMHAATTNIRKLLRDAIGAPEAGFIVRVGDHLRIDPQLIDTDLWCFQDALARAAHAPDDEARRASLHAAAGLWRGDLAENIDAVWIEEFRETLRRDAVDAVARLAQLCEREAPEQALTLLERAISIDRYQEPLYRRIMRIQGGLGRPDGARRTYQLLESRLTELGAEPDETTAQLLHQLLHPQDA